MSELDRLAPVNENGSVSLSQGTTPSPSEPVDPHPGGLALTETRDLTLLPEKAVEILSAARRVLDREGADGLTMRAVSQEAGIPSSLTMYYFGSMAQLEALLLDSLWRDEVTQHLKDLSSPPDSVSGRVDLLVGFHLRIAENDAGFRAYSELVAHVLRDRDTQQDLAKIYEMYRTELNSPLLRSPEVPRSLSDAYAAIVLAAGEGLPIGRLFGETDSSMREGFRFLSSLLSARIADPHGDGRPAGASLPTRRPGAAPAFATFTSNPVPTNATATKLLTAGAGILHRSGLRALTFSAISEASGEAKSLVSYHFKNKRGFIDALAHSLLDEWSVEVHRALIAPKRITAKALTAQLYGERSPLVSLILLQPALRHRPDLQQRADTAYSRAIGDLSELFAGDPSAGRARTSAIVFLATLNGLALQSRYDPEGFDLKAALDALLHLLPPRNV